MMMKMKSFSLSIFILLLIAVISQLSVASREKSIFYSHGERDGMEDRIISMIIDIVDTDSTDDDHTDSFLQRSAASEPDHGTKQVHDLFVLFQEWMSKHSKVWKSIEEMKARFDAFVDNHRYIETRNEQLKKEGSGNRLGLNGFAHLTFDEFQKGYLQTGGYIDHVGRRQQPKRAGSFMYKNVTDIPQTVDWRKKGALTGVKDQGQCGSCWAFSTVATVEAAHQIATGELVSLSEQELVDCDRAQNQGCEGGLMDYAFEFIVSNGGLDTEKDYPYTARAGSCNIRKRNKHVVSIDSYEDVPESDEEALLKAVAHQPVSVAINAEDRDFQLYHEGVFTGSCGKDLDHAVVVVGYGEEESGQSYWIVRNSWGEDWGEDGYVKMARLGSKDADGICGINMMPSYPVIHQSTAHNELGKVSSGVVDRFIRPLLPFIL